MKPSILRVSDRRVSLIIAGSIAALLGAQRVCGVDYSTYIAGTTPVAWWGMNEAGCINLPTTADLSGAYGAANNQAGTNLNLTYQGSGTNSLTDQTGYVYNSNGLNKAAYFNGTSDSGAFGHAATPYDLNITGAIYRYEPNGFAGEIWIKQDVGGNGVDTQRIVATREWGLGVEDGARRLHFTTFAKQDFFSTTSLSDDGLWHQIGFSYDGNVTTNFYIDGVAAGTHVGGTSGIRAALTPGANSINLAHRNTDAQHYKGFVDELVVWGQQRTAADFAASYLAAQTTPFLATAYWKGATDGVWNSNLNNVTTDLAGTTTATLTIDSATNVIFNASGATNFGSTTLGADTTIRTLTFGNSAISAVGIGGVNTLTITPNAATNGVTVDSGSGTHTISTNVALGAAQTWTVTDAGQTLNASGVMSGASAVTKAGAGTLVFSGNNSYSNGTTVAQGALALDYTVVGSKLSDGGSLTLASGTVDLRNGASAHHEVVASTTISAGLSSVTRSSGTSVLRMNGITPGLGVVNFGAAGIADTDTPNTNGILGGWATVAGTDWAKNSTDAADGAITAYNSYTDINVRGALIADGSTTNVRFQGDGNPGDIALIFGPTTINTLLQGNANFAARVHMFTETLATNGIMIGSGKAALTIGENGNDGTVQTATAGGTLFLNNFSASNALTINAVIADNTSASSLATVGRVVLTRINTYTGATVVNSGVLRVANNDALGTTDAGTTVLRGAALELAEVSGVTVGAELLTLSGTGIANDGALRSVSGFNSWLGTITLASAARINSDADTFTIGNNASSAIIVGKADLTLGGAGDGTVNGKISCCGGVTKDGAGVWTLSGANTYTGPTTLTAGTLSIATGSNLGMGTSNLVFNGGTLRITGNSTTSFTSLGRTVVFNSGQTVGLDIAAPANNFTGNLVFNQTTGGLTKSGAGTLTLNQANTYSGVTTIAQGTLKASSIVVSGGQSNLGNATSAVILGSATEQGTLSYTGASATYVRGFDVQLGGGTIEVTTAGQTLTLATGAIASGTDTSLTIRGAGHTTITAGVNLGGTSGALTKDGTGLLNINSGAQTYKTLTASFGAGTTNVNVALTAVGGTDVVADANLKFGSVSQTLNSLTIGSGVTVTFTSGIAAGAFSSGGKAAALVPEPGTLGLLLVGALSALGRRRRD